MNNWIDEEYAERVLSGLPMYRKSSGSFKLNCRCQVCGDSKLDTTKARFWAYYYQDKLRVGCFNCRYNEPFGVFLKDYYSEIYKEYIVEKFRKKDDKPVTTFESKSYLPINFSELKYCERLDKLPKDHPIVKYVANRKIPKSKYDRLFFTREWSKVANYIKPNTYPYDFKEARLVIPIYNKDGKIESIQGRSLSKDSKNKYITIKSCEEATKIYGMDLIDESKTVYFFEGPIDTLFVDNSCAITGGQLSLSVIPYSDRVFVLDNEPRHKDTMDRYEYYIENGENVVLWDKAPWESSDINDMIKNENAKIEDIIEYLENNIVSGLTAKLRFFNWKRC